MRDYKNLDVWKLSFSLCMKIYDVTANFPDSEKFGLSNQMRRAAVSVPSNMAEGAERNSDKDFHYFLGIAKGSLNELQTQVYIAVGRNYLSQEEAEKLDTLINEISKKLFRFMKKLSLN